MLLSHTDTPCDGINESLANMLTDTELCSLRPKEKAYKISDRDGMYVMVTTAGTKSFRYDYRLNGRRETLTIGKYDATIH